ncbi:osmotic avoidance abnormal protein 3 [Galendromus occidentalis]|uniref:Osmotic avoidance abnormal protein 3 n=1 Tax=Galendromus occidentalis TaxID=34638 RepID=A0AAJ7WGP5_9ACAR|nr:osmotic avoidance abnormal protein 3 [Galendromus occidentalis]
MQRSNLQVMVRPRKLPEGAQRGPIKLDKYGHEIEMLNNMFQYDVVFEEDATQEQVYERLRTAVEKLVEGYCVGILAYGQTSSGKTYTIGTNGVEECYIANPGIISRAASDIFRLAVPREETTKIIVKVTFMEIYNEQAFDLLHVDDKKKPVIKKVRDIPRKDRPNELVTDVEGLIAEEVVSTQGVMEVLQKGSKNRRVAATSMNANSSRSHAVFTIYVEHLNDEGESTLASTPYLQLVDLAGSEVPEGDKMTMKEGVNINKSLSALGRVIIQLRDRSGHVSYRDSVLTRVLKPLLDGNSITTLIACISMEERNEAESKKTLHYAQQARKIEISAQKAQKAITREEFLKLKDENRRLKKLCAQHNLEMGDLEMTIMEIKENETNHPDPAAKTEELIQLMLKYEATSKRNEVLQERCGQLEHLVEMFSKKFDDPDCKRPNTTYDEKENDDVDSQKEDGDEDVEPRDDLQNELSIVSALTTLDKDYDEHSNQLKYFVEMQKKSKELEQKVLELENQLEQSEKEKQITTKQMNSPKTSSVDFKELQKKLDVQSEQNRLLQEKLSKLKKELKLSSVNNETIEKYKLKVENINRERVKLQKLLKEQNKKSQEEIKRQKREMIALQRQQQKQASERSKSDAKQAAERRCQQRKLEQALAAKDRLEMLLKKKTDTSNANKGKLDKSKMNSSNTFNRVKELVDEEVIMCATRATTQFYIDDYTKQTQAFESRIKEIEIQFGESDLSGEARSELMVEMRDLVEKKANAQSVIDKNATNNRSGDATKFHEKFTTVFEAQLAIKQLIAKCEMLAYQTALYRDDAATLKEQRAHDLQLLADTEHQKQLVEEKYAAFLLEAENNRDDNEFEKLSKELQVKESMINTLQTKLSQMSQGIMIPRSPFPTSRLKDAKRRPLADRSVVHRKIEHLRQDFVDTSTLFSEDEQSFVDNPRTDPDWTEKGLHESGNSSSNLTRKRNTGKSSSENAENEMPAKMLKRQTSDAGCRCGGGEKSCIKCKCTKAGFTCSKFCKCLASCSNAPTDDDDTAQKIPSVISTMVQSIEGQKLY